MIVTIDGPAGSGKSTVAKQLAARLGVRFLDTGAMYRAIALAVLNQQINEGDSEAVTSVAQAAEIQFSGDRLILNGIDATVDIRRPDVTAISSVVAANPAVRSRLVELQRNVGNTGSLVTEGRDQGSIVFPNAEFKFFLTANLDVRARRRHRELIGKGSKLTLSTVRNQLSERDERDETRVHAPMKAAEDARQIDTSHSTIAQIVDQLCETVQGRQNSHSENSQVADSF